MSDDTFGLDKDKKSSPKLVASLREGIAVVQMIFFKELKSLVAKKEGSSDPAHVSMLCGAITNEIFGTPNTEERFVRFRKENKGVIEQYLFAIKDELPSLLRPLTDALRIQMLCDSQEQHDSSSILVQAEKLGILQSDREIPLPSTFMAVVRTLGEKHGLIIPPAQITPEDDQSLVH